MEFEITRDAGIATASLSGLALLEGWQDVLPRIGVETAARRDERVLIAIAGLVGYLGLPERRAIGRLCAMHLRHARRIAMLVPPEKVSGVAEAEARRLGLEFRVFSDRGEALAWLRA